MTQHNVIAILQARMGSTRLPGKVLKELSGKPVLWHILRRVEQANTLNRIVVAITNQPKDDPLETYLCKEGVNCFRGDEEDVLARFYFAAKAYNATTIVRLTADNPLVDPWVIDKLVTQYNAQPYHYAASKNYPLGLGAEMFSFDLLKEAYEKARKPYEREHVTPYMYAEGKKIGYLTSPQDLSAYRFTMDTDEDFAFIEAVYSGLYYGEHNFYLADIMDYLRAHPEIVELNKNVRQKKLGE